MVVLPKLLDKKQIALLKGAFAMQQRIDPLQSRQRLLVASFEGKLELGISNALKELSSSTTFWVYR